jgi:hypothetical protein
MSQPTVLGVGARGISTTSRHISFEFLFIKTCPPPRAHWLSWSREEEQGQTRHGVPRSSRRCKSHEGTALGKRGGKRSRAHAGCTSTVSRGTSRHAPSRSDEAPVNELTFTESERVASGCLPHVNWRKLKGVELCSTRGPDPPPHSLPHQENFFPPSVKSRGFMSSVPPGSSLLRLPHGDIVFYPTGRPCLRLLLQQIAAITSIRTSLRPDTTTPS